MMAERISHYRIVSKLGADGMAEGYQAPNSIATLRVRFCRPRTLSTRFDLTGLLKMVGAWGLEPQTSAVSRQRSTTIYPNNTGHSVILCRPPAQIPARLNLLLCYSRFSSSPHIHVEAKPQLQHSASRKELQ